jgi:hypothetical protein
MEDDEKNKDVEGISKRESFPIGTNDCDVFQSIWIRRNTILFSLFNRRFMEGQLRLVWYLGSIFWIIFLISKIF